MALIAVCVILVLGKAAPIIVTGNTAHIKEVNEVKNSLLEVNNRINFSGIVIGSVLLLVMLTSLDTASLERNADTIMRTPFELTQIVIEHTVYLDTKGPENIYSNQASVSWEKNGILLA